MLKKTINPTLINIDNVSAGMSSLSSDRIEYFFQSLKVANFFNLLSSQTLFHISPDRNWSAKILRIPFTFDHFDKTSCYDAQAYERCGQSHADQVHRVAWTLLFLHVR